MDASRHLKRVSALLKGLACKHLLEVKLKQRALLVCTLTLRTLHIWSLGGLRFLHLLDHCVVVSVCFKTLDALGLRFDELMVLRRDLLANLLSSASDPLSPF